MARTAKIGRYIVAETIGEGVFGKVKLAINEQTKVEYAMKILNKSDIRANELASSVRTEIAIMKALNHKNINGLCEVLSSKTKLYIVMDLVRGRELFSIVKEKEVLDEKLACSYFTQLVDGVEYCHENGVFHRDLKPENVLIDENSVLKITDFGVSAMTGTPSVEAQLLYTACGTPRYCAPEILKGPQSGYSGAKVDAWACGIILYVMLTGKVPFDDENMSELYKSIKDCAVDYPLWLSEGAKDLLEHILTPNPDERYSIKDIKNHYWVLGKSRREVLSMSSVSNGSSGSDRSSSSDPNLDETEEEESKPEEHGDVEPKEEERREEETKEEEPEEEEPKRTQSSVVLAVTADTEGKPALKQICREYEGQGVESFIAAVLPRKRRAKIEDIIQKLDIAGVDCLEDIEFLGEHFGEPEGVTSWLINKTKISDFCCMRIGRFLFV